MIPREAGGPSRPETSRVIGSAGEDASGTTVVFLAGLHGNEPAGIHALGRVLRRLRERPVALHGRVLGLAGNLAALSAGRRYLAADLNRLWTRDVVRRVRGEGPDHSVPEERELAELLRHLHAALDSARGRVLVLDLHTASSNTPPFVILGDTLRNRRFARRFPAPIILGLEEQLVGTLMEYVAGLGHVSVAFEGGQHDDPRSVDSHEACIWLSLLSAGLLREEDVPDAPRCRELLRGARRGLPQVLEISHRHPVEPQDGFVMKPGFKNFQPVRAGEQLATDRDGPILAGSDSLLFLPLYQGLGSDGFFLARPVNTVWLKVSTVLRQLRVPALAPLLPGVRRHPDLANTLVVDHRVARFLAPQLFHLLGYRVRSTRTGWEVARRREK